MKVCCDPYLLFLNLLSNLFLLILLSNLSYFSELDGSFKIILFASAAGGLPNPEEMTMVL